MADKKRAVVTGASRGIGRVTALELAKKGFDVSIVVRDRARGEQVQGELKALGSDAKLFVGDLSSMKEVARVAREVLAAHDRIHVLVDNAGALFDRRQTTVDGFEMTLATNHLAYFLFTNLLLPALEKAAPSRVVVVASAAHSGRKVPWDDLQHERGYTGWVVYGESKLENILFARELAKRLAGKGVTSNSLHPGFVASNFGMGSGFFLKSIIAIGQALFALSEEDGARTSVWAATSDELEKVTGKYFAKCREATPTAEARNDADAARLWKISEELVARAGVTLPQGSPS